MLNRILHSVQSLISRSQTNNLRTLASQFPSDCDKSVRLISIKPLNNVSIQTVPIDNTIRIVLNDANIGNSSLEHRNISVLPSESSFNRNSSTRKAFIMTKKINYAGAMVQQQYFTPEGKFKKKDLLQKQSINDMPIADIKILLEEVRIAQFPSHLHGLPTNFSVSKLFIEAFSKKSWLDKNKSYSSDNSYNQHLDTSNDDQLDIRDLSTGLIFSVIASPDSTKIYLSFGGTGSGHLDSNVQKKSCPNKDIFLQKQIKANKINALTNKCPEIYEQAAHITQQLSELMASKSFSAFNESELIVTGHSLGGGLAMYAATMCSTPTKKIKALCFSSAELGRGCLNNIENLHKTTTNAQQATANINDYTVQGDPLANFRNIIPGLYKVGNQITIPSKARLVATYGVASLHGAPSLYLDAYYHSRKNWQQRED